MIYWNEMEEKIIGVFIDNVDKYADKDMLLKWKDGSRIICEYDTYIEDETEHEIDDENYEEFWSIVFKVKDVKGEPPVYITEDKYFCVDYRNFPDEIIVEEKKIN